MRTSPGLSLLLFAISAAAAMDGDCSQGQLSQLVALLKDYAPAQTYCSSLIPIPPRASITTTTITQCQPKPTASKPKRDDEETTPAGRNDHNSTDSQANAFATLRRSKQASYAVCDCIVSAASPDPAIYITSPCPRSQYCSPSGDCKPHRNCNTPAHCDSSSYCLEAPAGACFCHPDTDDSSMGYCMSAGPPGRGCPDSYQDCSSNADCRATRVCIYACCRDEPFCVDLDDYHPDTPNYAAPQTLFHRAVVPSLYRLGVNPKWR